MRAPHAVGCRLVGHRDGGVVHGVAGGGSVVHGHGVDDGLEGGSRLAQGLHGAVVAGFVEIVSAHHRTDGAGFVLDDDHRYLGFVVADFGRIAPFLGVRPVVLLQVILLEKCVDAVEMGVDRILVHLVFLGELEVLDGLLLEFRAVLGDRHLGHAVGNALDIGVDGTENGDAVGIERVLAVLLFHVLADFFEVVQAVARFGFLFGEDDRRGDVLAVVFLADVACVVHGVKYRIAAFERGLRVPVGAVGLGCLEHAREDSVFGNGEAVERMPEVVFACGLEPVVAAAQVHLVHVEFKDFLLGVGLFDADGGHRFLDFTGDGAFRREEQELGQLLGEGGGSAELLAAQGTLDDGRRDGPDVHAPVLVEGSVFGRHHGVDCVFGDGVEGSPFAALHEVFVRDFPVHVIYIGDELRVDLLELREGREFGRVMVVGDDDADDSEEDRRKQDSEANQEFPVRKEIL